MDCENVTKIHISIFHIVRGTRFQLALDSGPIDDGLWAGAYSGFWCLKYAVADGRWGGMKWLRVRMTRAFPMKSFGFDGFGSGGHQTATGRPDLYLSIYSNEYVVLFVAHRRQATLPEFISCGDMPSAPKKPHKTYSENRTHVRSIN